MHGERLLCVQDLAKAREGFVLTSDMHLTYLVTPVDLSAWDRKGPDWNAFYKMLQALKVCTRRVHFDMPSYSMYVNPAGLVQKE